MHFGWVILSTVFFFGNGLINRTYCKFMNTTLVVFMFWLQYAYGLMFMDVDWKSFGCVENMEICHWVWCGHVIMWSCFSPVLWLWEATMNLNCTCLHKQNPARSHSPVCDVQTLLDYSGQKCLAKVTVRLRSSYRGTKPNAACLRPVGGPRL